MDIFTEKVREVDIVSIAERLGMNLVRSGRFQRALCPWHDDTKPSLVLGGKGNFCKCFACGNGSDNIGLVMQKNGMGFIEARQWIAEQYGIESPSPKSSPSMGRTSREEKTSLPIREENLALVDFGLTLASAYVSVDNSFSRCMAQVFPPDVVDRVTSMYYLGQWEESGNEDDVLFPSIDQNWVVRDMKIQHYCTDPQSPDFFHCDKRHIMWLGGLKTIAPKIPANSRIDRNCLFGEHLLTMHPSADVVLVESPKNACLGAAIRPDMVWVATGNKTMLKRDILLALRNRRVIVIPDRDAHEEWKQALDTMQDIATFHVSDVLKDMKEEKGDIGDYILIHNSQFIIHN